MRIFEGTPEELAAIYQLSGAEWKAAVDSLIEQGKAIMASNQELNTKIEALTTKLADLNTTIPAYITARDAIDTQLRADLKAAQDAFAADQILDASNETAAAALRDATITAIDAAIAKADEAKASLSPPAQTEPPTPEVPPV